MRLIILTLITAFVTSAAFAEGHGGGGGGSKPVFKPESSAFFSCAPSWKGEALVITIGTGTGSTEVRIWGEGLVELQKGGKKVVVNNDESPTGTGMAQQCAGDNCKKTTAAVKFKTLQLRAGGKIEGDIEPDGLGFNAIIAAKNGTCGG